MEWGRKVIGSKVKNILYRKGLELLTSRQRQCIAFLDGRAMCFFAVIGKLSVFIYKIIQYYLPIN